MRLTNRTALLLLLAAPAAAQTVPAPVRLLRPQAVFDGATRQTGWVVLVEGHRILAAGPAGSVTVRAGGRGG